MRSVKVLAVLLGAVMGVVTGLADSVSQGSTATFTVPTLIRLTVDTATIDFGSLTMNDYDLGYKELTSGQIVTVWSNWSWTLTVAADSATWTGPWAKPASDLQLRVASVSKRSGQLLCQRLLRFVHDCGQRGCGRSRWEHRFHHGLQSPFELG
jgi:hypothetical protein